MFFEENAALPGAANTKTTAQDGGDTMEISESVQRVAEQLRRYEIEEAALVRKLSFGSGVREPTRSFRLTTLRKHLIPPIVRRMQEILGGVEEKR
ncbi:MAG: hypothetical protein AAB846_01885 [Patescibacteria group bacterium]